MTLPCKFRQVGVEGQSELSVGSAGVELGKQGLPGECLVLWGALPAAQDVLLWPCSACCCPLAEGDASVCGLP